MSVLQSGRPAGAAVTTEQGGFAPMPVPGDLLSLTCWQAEIATEPATAPDANLDRSLLLRLADDLLPLGQIEVPGASALWLDLGRVVASVRHTASAETHVPGHAPGSGSRSCWPERRQLRGWEEPMEACTVTDDIGMRCLEARPTGWRTSDRLRPLGCRGTSRV
jgi:hypothetical protein